MRKRVSSLLIYCLLLAATTSCIDEPVRDQSNSKFVNLANFIEEQTALLDSLNPKVSKKVLINGEYEQQTMQNINWAKELELFLQADISKPALQANYEVEEVNKQVRIFKPKAEENPDIHYLKISFDEGAKEITSIEAFISQTNYLYHSEKKISLQCDKAPGGQTQISAYQITGFQKLIFSEKVPYEIHAKIL